MTITLTEDEWEALRDGRSECRRVWPRRVSLVLSRLEFFNLFTVSNIRRVSARLHAKFTRHMIQLLLVILMVGAVLLVPWIQGWDPEMLLAVISVILNLINVGMTVINCIQARRQDPRFLKAWVLGWVQLAIGASLLVVFSLTIGARPETWASSFPFLAGGAVVLTVSACSPNRFR